MDQKKRCVQMIDLKKISASEVISLARPWLDAELSTLTPARTQRLAARAALSLLQPGKGHLIENKEYGFYTLEAPGVKQYVSFTHNSEVAAASLSHAAIGIDVESIHRDASSVMPRVCRKSEIQYADGFSSIEGQAVHNAILLWTAKEALAKATGAGIRNGLTNFEVDLSAGPPFKAFIHQKGPVELKEPVISFRVWREHLLAICHEGLAESPIDLLIYPLS